MPIDFTCPECRRHYRVKDELAGKGAKCGKCGHKMQIPAAGSAPSSTQVAPAATPAKSAKASKPRSVSPTARAPASAKAPQPVAAASQAAAASWLDDELETSQPAVASAPTATAHSCPSCGASLVANAVLCVSCGYDFRTHAKHETRHVIDTGDKDVSAPKKERSKLSGAASLLRGTVFSFIAAIVGAAIWAGLAVLTDREFGLVAWGLGGLVGFGMALGHDDDDGTFAGIIAAFMSLFGIMAAKILIVVMVVAPMLAALANVDPVELQREWVATSIAEEKLIKDGIDLENASDEQWESAIEAANAEVAGLTEEELNKRAEQFQQVVEEPEAAAEPGAAQMADKPVNPVADDAAVAGEEDVPGGLIALFFASMFSPIDGIFILMAFFTAYAVGSGQMTD